MAAAEMPEAKKAKTDPSVKYPEQDLSEVLGKHIIYTYENGWQYEIYFKSADMIHYRIHSGLVAGRWVTNREVCMTALGKGLVRINWQEPVGNIVTMVTSLEDRWLHSYFLMPKWITEDPMATVCHEDEHVEEMLKRREQGPTWPMHIAENAFATITFLEDVGTGRDDIIDCPPDKLPAGYASRKN
ncbi:padC [Symbiodinium necroappetens]|uniref:PadC protein n=1 Tax=Symbiodinium necroappetens TaxID=1628268 RepID=A0A812MG74_9DINO|nr:padC [Symbiodinium necroappetens]CAE7381403.1 padC [Symbiodinium sp. KB8]